MAAAIQHWTDSGKIAAIDPYHLIFMIWASTQHYTDFLPQLTAVMGIKRFTKAHYGAAERSICDFILRGLLTSRGINSYYAVLPPSDLPAPSFVFTFSVV